MSASNRQQPKSVAQAPAAITLAALLALSACGSDNANDAPTLGEPVETQEAPAPAPESTPTPGPDNKAACLEFQFGTDPLVDQIPEALEASRTNAPGATDLMLETHVALQILIMDTDGPLAEALTELSEPLQTFNDAVYAGETQVDMDIVAVPYDIADVIEICDAL